MIRDLLQRGGLYDVIYRVYGPLVNRYGKESSINVLHDRKVVFVHNPKCAGSSIKQALGMSTKGADHRIPTHFLHSHTWETYTTFVVVRNPFDRLVSSHTYHTSNSYLGSYLRKYPFLKELSLEAYFHLMVKEPSAIRPQVDYTKHRRSSRPIDFVCRFESLHEDLASFFRHIGHEGGIPHRNKSAHNAYRGYFKCDSFRHEVEAYYAVDLREFGYTF